MTRIEIPRPEYPKPVFQRGTSEGVDWINLNGTWEFAFDPEDIGINEEWFSSDSLDYPLEICVPYPWESLAAWGEEEQADSATYLSTNAYLKPDEITCGGLVNSGNYKHEPRHTIGWYRRTVETPENWGDKRVILNFCAVDWETAVWVNGKKIGEHEGGYLPFEFDITDALTAGEPATIVVRAYDAQDHGEQLAGKQIGWYTRTSGIWQTVYLEPRNATYIKQCPITPDIDKSTATINVTVDGEIASGTELHWECDGMSGQVTASENTVIVVEIPSDKLRLWDVDTPNLYDVTLNLVSNDSVLDTVQTYFGMRKVSIEKAPGGDYNYIYLNNRPVYLLGALNQSFNPEGVYTFLTDEAIRTDVERSKEFGFNFLRLHIKVDEPRLYYWADKLGLLFMCDIPNFGNYTDLAKSRFVETLRGNIARDFNHPSIISWCNFNETWGLGGGGYKEQKDRQEWVREMYHLAKTLDPTRLIEDNSPCLYDHVETDINSWHFYINNYKHAKDHIANVVEQTYPGSKFNYAGDNEQTDVPLINSEYGGISAGAGDKDVAWCFKYLTNELRLHPKICGYVYTELQDIEWEHNGFMNYDRSVKEFGYDYNDINTLDFIAIDYPPGTTVAPDDIVTADIYTSHFSHKQIEGTTLHWQLDTLEKNGELTYGLISNSVEIPFPQYQVEQVHQLKLTIPDTNAAVGTLHVWVSDETGAVVARNYINFEIYIEDAAGLTSLSHLPGEISSSKWDGATDVKDQLLMAQGAGYVEYQMPLPAKLNPDEITKMELVFEASSSNGGSRQTEPEKYPSDVTISVNGAEVDTISIPDCPADARGVLTYIHENLGNYGYLYRVQLDKETCLSDNSNGTITVRYEVKGNAENRGGLTLYGNRRGRYPTAPHIVIT